MSKKFVILLAIIFFFIGSFSAKILCSPSTSVIATDVETTINNMTVNNPVKLLLDEKIKQIEEISAREEAERKRLEEIRIAEEKQLEELRLLEERKLAAESKFKAEKELAEQAQKNPKVAYLTFDDGPSNIVTPKILDILADYNIKATFFVLGKMVDVNPSILKRIYDEGHSIGNHSYSHVYSYIYKNLDNFFEELGLAEEAMKRVLGQDFETSLLRLPGGSHSPYKKKFVEAAEEMGYRVYDWNALNGDAEGIDLDKDRLIERFKSTVKGQKELIILMHDTDAKTSTAEALPEIIEYLISKGYVFKKLEQ
ncbi:MAG: polysaccharide deacetylase [Tissierellia bacterium]|nr:polysaccharide deacetylase [Tissierellia bacterium]